MPVNTIKPEYYPEQRGTRIETTRVTPEKRQFRVSTLQTVRSDSERQKKQESKPAEQNEFLRGRTIEELKTIISAIQLGVTDDWKLTDLIFYARHPELKGTPLTAEKQDLLDEWNTISALLVHPALNEIKDVIGAASLNGIADITARFETAVHESGNLSIDAGSLSGYTTRYDDVIANAVEWCPGLSPSILKSLLAQESRFNPTVINKYGYAGIAQFGRPAAREVGLSVGIPGTGSDERLDPTKAIPGAARLLNLKAQRLGSTAFAKYGQPDGIEFWKFVTAAYNGGEGTVSVAMGHAYRTGLDAAKTRGLVGREAVAFARNYASKWENLKIGGMSSPLGLAAARYFPTIASQKYLEIGNYPTHIVARVAGTMR